MIASKNIQDEDKRKDDRIIYTIDKDMPVIKNPFSFEHEEKSDIKVIMNEDKKENKMDNRKVKVQTEQEEILKINKDETQIKNLTNNKQKIYKVKAILDFNQQKVALFSIDNKLYRVRQGDMIGDIKILAIESNSLILQENTGKKIKCPLT